MTVLKCSRDGAWHVGTFVRQPERGKPSRTCTRHLFCGWDQATNPRRGGFDPLAKTLGDTPRDVALGEITAWPTATQNAQHGLEASEHAGRQISDQTAPDR